MSETTHGILETFWTMNQSSVEPEGIRIPHAVYLGANGGVGVAAIAMFGREAGFETYKAIGRLLIQEQPKELVFGIDRYALPGQCVPTADLLSVAHWNGLLWSFGVIAYQYDPFIFGPVDWHNDHWSRALAGEMTNAWIQIKAAPHRQPSPAMQLPLRVRTPLPSRIERLL